MKEVIDPAKELQDTRSAVANHVNELAEVHKKEIWELTQRLHELSEENALLRFVISHGRKYQLRERV
jgi:ribosomal protein L29